MEQHTLYIVTGAPGSGKSTTVEALTNLGSAYMAFDIDWLAPSASELAGKSIYFDPSTWQPYGKLWFDILRMIYRNGRTPIFFAPTDPDDIARDGQPEWCNRIEWLLLDCDDQTRRDRLARRPDWTETRVAEALEDAAVLRELVDRRVETSQFSPIEVAHQIIAWLEESHE